MILVGLELGWSLGVLFFLGWIKLVGVEFCWSLRHGVKINTSLKGFESVWPLTIIWILLISVFSGTLPTTEYSAEPKTLLILDCVNLSFTILSPLTRYSKVTSITTWRMEGSVEIFHITPMNELNKIFFYQIDK